MSEKSTETSGTGVRAEESSKDFIREIIDRDLAAGKNGGRVITLLPNLLGSLAVYRCTAQ